MAEVFVSNLAHIFSYFAIFSSICATNLALSTDIFKIVPHARKGFSSHKNAANLKPSLKCLQMSTLSVAIVYISKAVSSVSVTKKQSQHITLTFVVQFPPHLASWQRQTTSLTSFYPQLFGSRRQNWLKCLHRPKLFITLLFTKLKQPNLAESCCLRTCINPANFARYPPIRRNYTGKICNFKDLGAINPHP